MNLTPERRAEVGRLYDRVKPLVERELNRAVRHPKSRMKQGFDVLDIMYQPAYDAYKLGFFRGVPPEGEPVDRRNQATKRRVFAEAGSGTRGFTAWSVVFARLSLYDLTFLHELFVFGATLQEFERTLLLNDF